MPNFEKLIAWCDEHPHQIPSTHKPEEAKLAYTLYTLRAAKRKNTCSKAKFIPAYSKIAKEHNLSALFDLRRKPAQALA